MDGNTDKPNPVTLGELGSDSSNGDGKPVTLISGDKGFADPEISRITSGAEPTDAPASGQPGTTANPTGGSAAPVAARKRGRPPGSGKSTAEPKPAQAKAEPPRNLNFGGLDKILFSIHAMGAAMLSVPELELTEPESKKLGNAIEAVNDQFKLAFDPKKAALIDLTTTVGVIYGPRCVSLYMRKKMERAMQPRPVAPEAPLNRTTSAPEAKSTYVPFDPTKIAVN